MRLLSTLAVAAGIVACPTMAPAQDATIVRLLRDVCAPLKSAEQAAPIARSLGMTRIASDNPEKAVFRSADGDYELTIRDMWDATSCAVVAPRTSMASIHAAIAAASGGQESKIRQWQVTDNPPRIFFIDGL